MPELLIVPDHATVAYSLSVGACGCNDCFPLQQWIRHKRCILMSFTWDREQLVNMPKHGFRGPRQHRPDCEIIHAAL